VSGRRIRIALGIGALLAALGAPVATATPGAAVETRADDIEAFLIAQGAERTQSTAPVDVDVTAYLEARDPDLLDTVDVALVESLTAVWQVAGAT